MSTNAGMTDDQLASMGWQPNEPDSSTMAPWTPFVRDVDGDTVGGRAWHNSRYSCIVGKEFLAWGGKKYPGLRIQVCNLDQSAWHDWRDFQRIKNDLAGAEWEAVELYPAESRLRDPSNAFYLWCFPPGVLTALGWRSRIVCHPDESIAPQRKFGA